MKETNEQLNEPQNPAPTDDTFHLDPEKLRLPQNFGAIIGGKKELTTILVRRPDPQVFIQINPNPAYRLTTAVLEVKEEREHYLVDKSLWDDLSTEIVLKCIYTGITRQGNPFLWLIRLPGSDGKLDSWNQSAHEIAAKAMSHWVRIVSNRQIGAYEFVQPSAKFSDPDWPPLSFKEILCLAFKERFIRDLTHPVLKKLRGEL
jgi:hypothetical protein